MSCPADQGVKIILVSMGRPIGRVPGFEPQARCLARNLRDQQTRTGSKKSPKAMEIQLALALEPKQTETLSTRLSSYTKKGYLIVSRYAAVACFAGVSLFGL